MKNKKGFTLIELLVVIAIIGILSSIVLVSLGGARERARDARITAELAQVRAIAELINSDYGAYNNTSAPLCDGTTLNSSATMPEPYRSQIGAIKADITTQGGTSLTCYSNATSYCASVDLNSIGPTGWHCINSAGQSLATSSSGCNAAGDTNCNLSY